MIKLYLSLMQFVSLGKSLQGDKSFYCGLRLDSIIFNIDELKLSLLVTDQEFN